MFFSFALVEHRGDPHLVVVHIGPGARDLRLPVGIDRGKTDDDTGTE